tara:strand:+ start:139 stop:594 length:456 start_codon:yes stop_codon:yes gene_type:complete
MAKSPLADNLKIIEKIPFFQALSPNQVHQLLDAGRMLTYEKGHLLCREGDKSTDMFILLAGELAVKKNSTTLASVKPVEVVGEMGLISGQPRSATVEVSRNATLIILNKLKFDVTLKKDSDAAAKVYKNILATVCNRLREANARLIDMRGQ